MYYDRCIYRGGRSLPAGTAAREPAVAGKVVKKTVANITDWPDAVKAAVRGALEAGRDEGASRTLSEAVAGLPGFRLRQGKSVGALFLLRDVAERLGLSAALGSERQGRLALWQVLARIQDQGSRLSAVRLARQQTVAELLALPSFTEDDLYANLTGWPPARRPLKTVCSRCGTQMGTGRSCSSTT